MPAVSPDPPRVPADLTTSAGRRRRNGETGTIGHHDGHQPHEPAADADFGPNEWLVDELYQRYLDDPQSVDRAWWNFFADYRPDAAAAAGLGRAEVRASGGRAGTADQPREPGGTDAQAAGTQGTGGQATGGLAAGTGGQAPRAQASRQQEAAPAAPAAAPTARGQAPPSAAPRITASGPAGSAGPAGPAGSVGAAAAAPATAPQDAPPGAAPAAAPAAAAPGADAATRPKAAAREPHVRADAEEIRLRGAAARTALNMAASLSVPTATSVRTVPAKLLIDNRIVINNHLKRGRGGKASFTHLIGFAIVRALNTMPELNASFAEVDGKPALIQPEHVNLGLAIDVRKADGSRQLLVPNIKAAENLDFRQFWMAYEDVVRKARSGKLDVADFAGTTISITNPGTIGTEHSVPRLMPGQGCIIGVGAMEYPASYQGASAETLARLAISKAMTLTSTYDHRVIQGAQSGEFLRRIHGLLLGADGFYDEIFQALRIPYEPVRWVQDIPAGHEDDIAKSARCTS